MGTSFSYVCLTHDPQLESDVDIHGHGSVTNSTRVTEMRALWKFVTGQSSSWSGSSEYNNLAKWLERHRRCKVGVTDGYGGMVELGEGRNPVKPAAPVDTGSGSQYEITLPQDLADYDNRRWVIDQLTAMSAQAGKGWMDRLAEALRSVKSLPLGIVPTKPASNLKPVAPTAVVTEQRLLDAVERARGKAKEGRERWATEPEIRTEYHTAAVALELLGRELALQERDGSGTPPAETTGAATPAAAESATIMPDPSPTTKLVCTCQRIDVTLDPSNPQTVPGLKDDLCDFHGYRDRELAGIGLCGWKHPWYRGMRCNMRADQYHMIHEQNDVFGTMSWDPKVAVIGPGVPAYVKDWPEWKGTAT